MKQTKGNKIEDRLTSILKENTGVHMLDSGGANNRKWQKNRRINFEKQPEIMLDFWKDDEMPYIHLSVFHYLRTFLSITKGSENMNKIFQKERAKRENDCDLEIMESFAKVMQNKGEAEYNTQSSATNTYNYDNLLSQVLQYCTFHNNKNMFIILQVHNGADVRGGYTVPQIFQIEDIDYFYMTQSDVEAIDEDGNSWYSDDSGNSFYPSDKEKEFKDIVKVKGKKVFNNETGKEIKFHSMLEQV